MGSATARSAFKFAFVIAELFDDSVVDELEPDCSALTASYTSSEPPHAANSRIKATVMVQWQQYSLNCEKYC